MGCLGRIIVPYRALSCLIVLYRALLRQHKTGGLYFWQNEQLKHNDMPEFLKKTSTANILIIVAVVAVVGFYLYSKSKSSTTTTDETGSTSEA